MEDDRIGQPSLSSVQRSLRYHWFFTIGNVGVTLFLVVFIVLKPEVAAFNSAGNPAVPPLTLNYQGRLVDGNGVAVTGAVPLQFEIFDSLEGGTSEWGPELHPAVVVQNGLFQVSLGSVSGGIPLDIWENSLYLEVQVGEDILAPRELIQPAATAGVAFTVPDGAITTAKIADGAVTQAKAPSLIASETAENTKIYHGYISFSVLENTSLLVRTIELSPQCKSILKVFIQPTFSNFNSVTATVGQPWDETQFTVYLTGQTWSVGQVQDFSWLAICDS